MNVTSFGLSAGGSVSLGFAPVTTVLARHLRSQFADFHTIKERSSSVTDFHH